MKTLKLSVLISLLTAISAFSQGPRNKDFGFGIILGDPTGLTAKIWMNNENALALSLGNSYFGSFRITGDYLWHFSSFNTPVVKLYAGPGIAIGVGEGGGWIYRKGDKYWWVRDDNGLGLGVRGIFGINIIPRNTPLEFFGEIGVLVGVVPGFGATGEGAIGIRFYP